MRKLSYKSYVAIGLILFTMVSLPEQVGEKFRFAAISSLAPSWQGVLAAKSFFVNLLAKMPTSNSSGSSSESLEVDRLLQENQMLRIQIESVREWLLLEDRIEEQLERLNKITHHGVEDPFWKEFFKRRSEELCQTLDLQIQSLPAKIIFREPDSWSSSLWVNVGEKDNEILGKKVVAKNSPVLVGTSIVGVVEEVGVHQSRIRLITDSSLVPSVRALRGAHQNLFLQEHLESLIFALSLRDDLFSSEDESAAFSKALRSLRDRLTQYIGDRYLAKGELYGCSHPLWRSRSQILRGVGFNYDYPDEEGPARDLRTGEYFAGSRRGDPLPILKPGDLLVTTGLDGIFPPGFEVAIVSKIQPLREGGSAYELEARVTAGNLDELTHVFILPPLEFNK